MHEGMALREAPGRFRSRRQVDDIVTPGLSVGRKTCARSSVASVSPRSTTSWTNRSSEGASMHMSVISSSFILSYRQWMSWHFSAIERHRIPRGAVNQALAVHFRCCYCVCHAVSSLSSSIRDSKRTTCSPRPANARGRRCRGAAPAPPAGLRTRLHRYTHTPARLTGALSTYRAPPVFFTTGRSQLSSRSPHTRERRELLAQLLHLGRYQVLHEAAAWQRVVSAGMTLSASPAITSDNNRLFWPKKEEAWLPPHPGWGGPRLSASCLTRCSRRSNAWRTLT